MERKRPWKPKQPPYLEEHHRGKPSPTQLGKILFHHAVELVGHTLYQGDAEKLAADLMAPTASEAQIKTRDAAWAKRDEVWAEYRIACRKYEEALCNMPDRTAGDHKRQHVARQNKEETKASKEDAKCSTFVVRSLDKYKQAPVGKAAAALKAWIAEEAKQPAIKAMAQNGMCECAGALGTVATWAMLMWFAARACRKQLDDASLDTTDAAARSAFLLEFFQSLSKLDGEAAAAFEVVPEETLEALSDIKWPQKGEFDEAQCRITLENAIKGTPSRRTKKLDSEVVRVCGIRMEDLRARKLDEGQKFQLIVDKKRADFVTPLEKTSRQLKFFNALVANPDISLEDVSQLITTIVVLSHGSSIATNLMTGVMDPRVLEDVRDAYLQAEAAGKIKDPQEIFKISDFENKTDPLVTGPRFTQKLMRDDRVPSVAQPARGRFSILNRRRDAKTHSKSLLTAEAVVPIVVLYGAVREVEITEEVALGIVVVAVVLGPDIYHVLCHPGDFVVTNPFTVDCMLQLFTRFAPVLALAPRQRVSNVLPLKMSKRCDGGFVVGSSSNPAIVAEVKSAVPKVIGQMDSILGAAVEAAAANKVSNVPAHLLTARLASATSSGELPPFVSTADGLATGFGFDVPAWRDLIKSMPNIADISKAVGPIGHILCSCPTPDPPPAPAPAPQPTNVNDTDPRNAWTDREWDEFAQQHG